MGKILSKPKMPDLPVFTPTPVVEEPPAPDPEIAAAAQREQDVLNRRRGRIGTITTSFRGVLNDSAFTPTRKTLLGE